jgi:SAM-dependent methyltransferase
LLQGHVDVAYADPRLASLYDALNPWGRGDDFYLRFVQRARSVLDLGCGTGLLLRRAKAEGHGGILVGVDAAEAMLVEARAAEPGVVWRQGDARTVGLARRFDLVLMTGHAFQAFLTDAEVTALLENVRRHVAPGGRFAFETRNPAARAWERWTPERSRRSIETRDGTKVEVAHGPATALEPDVVEFSTTFRFEDADEPLVSRSALRFVDPGRLRRLLTECGFRVDGWFGDWDRSPVDARSPEIVVVAAARSAPK